VDPFRAAAAEQVPHARPNQFPKAAKRIAGSVRDDKAWRREIPRNLRYGGWHLRYAVKQTRVQFLRCPKVQVSNQCYCGVPDIGLFRNWFAFASMAWSRVGECESR